MVLETVPAHAGFESGEAGQAYNEAGFKHFLAIERRRAQRASTSVLLVLVGFRGTPGTVIRIPTPIAARLFDGLGACVREIDFVGWYREGRVASAAMIQSANAPADVRRRMLQRVTHALQSRLSVGDAGRLRVRVLHLKGQGRG